MVPEILLASNSPRRRELLALTGWSFSVHPVDIDESPHPGEDPAAYVLRLAENKGRAAGAFAQAGQKVLSADTTVAYGQQILGKPANVEEARLMLRDLRDRQHAVYTAIGVFDPQTGRIMTDLCATRVWMRNYSDEEMEAYIASGDPFDKAGGYAIQNPAFHPVERIEGCYACVVGLPVCHVARALAQFGLTPPAQVTGVCPEHLEIDTPCPAFENIMRGLPGGGSKD